MKNGLLIAAVCLSNMIPAAAQDLNGFKLRMSKLDVCRYVHEHPTHSFKGETRCPETDNRVVVSITQPEFSFVSPVALAFDYHGTVSAIWSTFRSSEFDSVYVNAVKKFGRPTWQKEYTTGKDGASFPNRLVYWHSKTADIYLERQNKLENGEMMGWLAINSPSPFSLIPPALFLPWPPPTGQVDPLYWNPQ